MTYKPKQQNIQKLKKYLDNDQKLKKQIQTKNVK
jgi:hypothetical protein